MRVPARHRRYAGRVTARGTVSKKHQTAILKAKAAKDRADAGYEAAIRAAATDPEERASVRELAAFLGISKNTVSKIVNGE